MSRRSRALRPRQSADMQRESLAGSPASLPQSLLGAELADLANIIRTDPQPPGNTQADLELKEVLHAAAPAFAVDHVMHRGLTENKHYTPRMSLWRPGGEGAQQAAGPLAGPGSAPLKAPRAERRAAARQAERSKAVRDTGSVGAADGPAVSPASASVAKETGQPAEWGLIGIAVMPPSLVPAPAELRKSMRETMAECGAKVAVWSCRMSSADDSTFIFLAAVHAEGPEVVAVSSQEGKWRRVPANAEARDRLLSFYLDSARRSVDRVVSEPAGDSPRAVVARDLLAAGVEAQSTLDGVFELNERFSAAISAEKAAAQEALDAAKRTHEKAMARSLKDLKKTEALLAAATARSAELQRHLRAAAAAKDSGSLAPLQREGASHSQTTLAHRADALFFAKDQEPASSKG